jgi:hypothetical protein
MICMLAIRGLHVLTSFIRANVLPRYRILLVHLVLQMLLPLRQHLQRTPQAQNGILGAVLFLCSVTAPKAAESPGRHDVGRVVVDGEESHSNLFLRSLRGRLGEAFDVVCFGPGLCRADDPPRAWSPGSESYRLAVRLVCWLAFLETSGVAETVYYAGLGDLVVA